MQTIERLKAWVKRALWGMDPNGLNPFRARLIRAVRIAYGIGRDLRDGQLTLQAMSLVYTTLLSLVPLLAVSFSVLKAFGVHNQIQPLLSTFLAPLGEKGDEITLQVIGFVENIKVGVLGALGLGLLIYTVTALLQKVEQAFNYTWRVKRTRSLAQQFSHYLSVVVIGPVLVFAALGLTGTLMHSSVMEALLTNPTFGWAAAVAGKLLPYVLVIVAFTFVYIFIPNTHVRFSSALLGGVVAGILWETGGWLFASFVVTSAKYTAIYAGFAIVIMFMIWLYVSWLILLIGASLAFYHQHPEFLTYQRRELKLSHRVHEQLSLLALALIGRTYYENRPPWTLDGLTQQLGVPVHAVERVIRPLERAGILSPTADDPPRWLPARPPESVSLKEILDTVRHAEEDRHLSVRQLPTDPTVHAVFERLDQAVGESLMGQSFKDLALGSSDAARPIVRQALGP